MNKLKKIRGITLIELMIVIIIVSIMTIIGAIIYSSQITKSRRMDAINVINSIALAEESYRSTNTQYGTLTNVWGGVSTSPEGYYTISITNTSATSYTITATAVGNQANDKQDTTSCSTLQFSVSNGSISKSPSVCWPN